MSSPAKEFHIDAVYPEHLSRLRRGGSKPDLSTSVSSRRASRKQQRKGNVTRFRTQPVTFHEIKEVDEENLIEGEELGATSNTAASTCKSDTDLKIQFELFYKSIARDSGTVSDPEEAKHGTTTSSERFHPLNQEMKKDDPCQFNPRSRPSL